MLRVQKCNRRKIAFANKTGTMPDVIGKQYIEQPRMSLHFVGISASSNKIQHVCSSDVQPESHLACSNTFGFPIDLDCQRAHIPGWIHLKMG